jgi:hypothetical protein
MRRERASDRSRLAYDRSVDCIHSSDPGCHTWRCAHLDGSDESRGSQRRPTIPRARVNFTDALGFFHPGSVTGVGLFKIGRLGRSLAYIRSSFHLVILSKYYTIPSQRR